MRAAFVVAAQSLPAHSHKFSRHDFTLAQLFACLAVKELLKRSYRGAEEVLRDSPGWLADVGLRRAPDHNTLCRAAGYQGPWGVEVLSEDLRRLPIGDEFRRFSNPERGKSSFHRLPLRNDRLVISRHEEVAAGFECLH